MMKDDDRERQSIVRRFGCDAPKYVAAVNAVAEIDEIFAEIDACTDLATLAAIATNDDPERMLREVRLSAEHELAVAGFGGRRRRGKR